MSEQRVKRYSKNRKVNRRRLRTAQREARKEAAWMRKQAMRTMSRGEKREYRKKTRQEDRQYRRLRNSRLTHEERVMRDSGIALLVLAVIMLFVIAGWAYIVPFRGMNEPKTKLQETNRNAAVYPSEGTMKFAMSLFFPELAGKIERTYVIPGMKAAKTLQGEFHASAMCTSMTPQGMCVTEDYLIVSAYCHIQKHNSVLYLIDKESGELLKTIPLGGKAHVGGVAYDPEHRIVWVSGGSTGAAKAVAYLLKDLENYDEYSRAPVTAIYNYTLAAMIRNSYMAYSNRSLIVGLFKKSGLSSITWYDLTEEGGLNAQIFAEYDAVHESVIPDHTAVTSGEVQGVSQVLIPGTNRSRLLLSKSYGPFDSALQIHTAEDGDAYFRDKDSDRIIRFPQKMEQICEADGKVYCLFESGAYPYRMQPSLIVDRILVFDRKSLLE